MKRQVHTVHLRSHDEALIRRGAVLLEDALHTASLPEDGRLLLVRSLNVGKIQAQQSSATLALVVEQRLAQIGMMAVHAEDPAAETAIAVYFRDQAEAYMCLAVRLANHLGAEEWFWRLAIVDWQANLSREEGLRRVLYGIVQTPNGTGAIASLMQELLERNAITPMLASLTWQAGAELLQVCGWFEPGSSIQFNHPLSISFLSRAWIRLLQHWIEVWGVEDARSLWLATIALLAEQPAFILDEQLMVRSQQVIQHINTLEQHSDRSTIVDSPATALGNFDLQFDLTDESIGASPHQHSEPQFNQADESIGASSKQHSELQFNQLYRSIKAPQQHSDSFLDSPQLSRFAGLFFLVPLMSYLGIESLLTSNPQLIEFDLPNQLLYTLAKRVSIPETDPVWQALPQDANPDLELDLLRSWRVSMRRWCRLNAGMGLHNLVNRSGQVLVTRTHIEVWFEPQQADIRIRRVGLDLDPGWVPWLGRVIAFHYTGAEYGN